MRRKNFSHLGCVCKVCGVCVYRVCKVCGVCVYRVCKVCVCEVCV